MICLSIYSFTLCISTSWQRDQSPVTSCLRWDRAKARRRRAWLGSARPGPPKTNRSAGMSDSNANYSHTTACQGVELRRDQSEVMMMILRSCGARTLRPHWNACPCLIPAPVKYRVSNSYILNGTHVSVPVRYMIWKSYILHILIGAPVLVWFPSLQDIGFQIRISCMELILAPL